MAPNHTFIFAYIGHGLLYDGDSYLVPWDAILGSEQLIHDTCLSLDKLMSYWPSQATQQIIMLDLFRRDPTDPSGKRINLLNMRFVQKWKMLLNTENAALFLASSEGQRSYASDNYGEGFFMHFVIDGFKHQAGDRISIYMLADYVQKGVSKAVKEQLGLTQVPMVMLPSSDIYLSKHPEVKKPTTTEVTKPTPKYKYIQLPQLPSFSNLPDMFQPAYENLRRADSAYKSGKPVETRETLFNASAQLQQLCMRLLPRATKRLGKGWDKETVKHIPAYWWMRHIFAERRSNIVTLCDLIEWIYMCLGCSYILSDDKSNAFEAFKSLLDVNPLYWYPIGWHKEARECFDAARRAWNASKGVIQLIASNELYGGRIYIAPQRQRRSRGRERGYVEALPTDLIARTSGVQMKFLNPGKYRISIWLPNPNLSKERIGVAKDIYVKAGEQAIVRIKPLLAEKLTRDKIHEFIFGYKPSSGVGIIGPFGIIPLWSPSHSTLTDTDAMIILLVSALQPIVLRYR